MPKKTMKKNIILTMVCTLLINITPLSVAAATTNNQNDESVTEIEKTDISINKQDLKNIEEMSLEDKEALEYYLETGEFPESYALAPWLVTLSPYVAGPIIEWLTTFSLDQAYEYMTREPNGINQYQVDNTTKDVQILYSTKFNPASSYAWVGDRGTNNAYYVRLLQRALTSAGYSPGPVDGYWGPKTKAALMKFQSDYNLTVDGSCGPATWRRLAHK